MGVPLWSGEGGECICYSTEGEGESTSPLLHHLSFHSISPLQPPAFIFFLRAFVRAEGRGRREGVVLRCFGRGCRDDRTVGGGFVGRLVDRVGIVRQGEIVFDNNITPEFIDIGSSLCTVVMFGDGN